mgnify:CR=1 FL=1
MLFQGIEFISWFTVLKEIHWFSCVDSKKMCLFIRCVAAKGEDAPECDKFAKYYRSLCPGEWVCIFCFLNIAFSTFKLSFLLSL